MIILKFCFSMPPKNTYDKFFVLVCKKNLSYFFERDVNVNYYYKCFNKTIRLNIQCQNIAETFGYKDYVLMLKY